MLRINTFGFFTLAKNLKPIESIADDATYGDAVILLASARWQVETLLRNEVIPIRTSRQAASQIVDAINQIVPVDLAEAFQGNKDKTEVLGWYLLNPVKEAVAKFETVLAEELAVMDTYSVSQKGAYSTPELIANAEVMIPKDLRAKLPRLAIYDIREAGRCLAFESPTAAAFHILRAVEAVLLKYYIQIMGGATPPRMRNWGVYIKNLRNSGKASDKILNFVDHIRETYRNPIAHPDAVMKIEEVLVLFGVATAAMVQMALELNAEV